MTEIARVHERTVQAVARGDIEEPSTPKRTRGKASRPNTSKVTVTQMPTLNGQVWEAVKRSIRPGMMIVIESETCVLLLNDNDVTRGRAPSSHRSDR